MTSELKRTLRCPRARPRAAAVTAMLALLALILPAASSAAPPLAWTGAGTADTSSPPSSISCPTETLCVGVDGTGGVIASPDPTSPSPSWERFTLGAPFTSVSCGSSTLCVAVAADGTERTSEQPTNGATWTLPTRIEEGAALTGVSCPTAALCVAVDNAGRVWTRPTPTASWSPNSIAGAPSLRGVSCAATAGGLLCAAIDTSGHVYASESPSSSGSWHPRPLVSGLDALACDAQGACVALAEDGEAFASADASSGAPPTWSSTQLGAGPAPTLACAPSGLCVIAGGSSALASDAPAGGLPMWTESAVPSARLLAISCMVAGFCIATDTGGHAFLARVPAPGVATAPAAVVTEDGAQLAGTVDPNDAALTACYFEYGTTTAYGTLAPCASAPAPGATPTPVAATLSGLDPNTTYHYRLVAGSATGVRAGADTSFTTAISSQFPLVYPHPAIHGTPAVGQRLTCASGAGPGSQLTYTWLRDLIAIPFATGSTYTVKGADSGHHLQCEVSSSDPGGVATARSAFVTIPVGGVPVSAGETKVGSAHWRGRTVTVSVSCSAHASAGCNVLLRLTTVETLSGRRVVALAAATRRATVTLASARAFLARGSGRTITMTLTSGARRLLAARHTVPARLTATGTVIGVIEATISQQNVQLGGSSQAARRRRRG